MHPARVRSAAHAHASSSSGEGSLVPELPTITDKDLLEHSRSEGPAERRGVLGKFLGWFQERQARTGELRKRLGALGLAAVLAYGLFDAVSYTIAFCLAFLSYEAKTGLNPMQNVGDIVKICVLMWAGNNVTRPFRLAGAAGLAPFMDRMMNKLRDRLRLPSRAAAFAVIVVVAALLCGSAVGTLVLSRYVRG
ncbi:hypothetical protein WJX72_006610 [[Myrmecia] bisecta]|uniref:Uncharacterized protein n=1 Tax=[Myrmecia] bisecta TaxID=41462 RepID=A0AAW1R731_9CHLO